MVGNNRAAASQQAQPAREVVSEEPLKLLSVPLSLPVAMHQWRHLTPVLGATAAAIQSLLLSLQLQQSIGVLRRLVLCSEDDHALVRVSPQKVPSMLAGGFVSI